MKLNLGCGTNILGGWENHDADVDITKPLPYPDNSVEAVFCEHCVEHVTPQDAWNFFEECLRVLQPNGVIRIAVPSVEKIEAMSTDAYEQAYFAKGFADSPTKKGVVKGIIFNHGHKSTWSQGVLESFLRAAGFKGVSGTLPGSSYYGLDGVEGHGKVIGDQFNMLETIVAEGLKD